ncbi:MAG: hypothetical protein ACRBBP_05925 [Bdellovibrionales bacterium]
MKRVVWCLVVLIMPMSFIRAESAVYVFSDTEAVLASEEEGGEPLEGYFSKNPEFNYFYKHALNPQQSLFMDGVDQRFLSFDYNGFSLRDPSHPSGIFNMSALVSSIEEKKVLHKPGALSVLSDKKEGGFLRFGISHLGEALAGFQKGSCNADFCYGGGAAFRRGGGFSQKAGGVERDYFNKVDLNFHTVKYRESFEDKTYLFYSGQVFDEDSVGVFDLNESESKVAKSKGATLFFGKAYRFKEMELRGFYLASYRTQKNREKNLSYSQRGEVFEAQIKLKKFQFNLFNERYDLFSSSGSDLGGLSKYSDKAGEFLYNVQLGYTKERKAYGGGRLEYKNFSLFFDALSASLYQANFNKEFSANNEDLKTQNIVGFEFFKNWSLGKTLNLGMRTTYSRTFDFIDYNLNTNLYENLDEIETATLKIDATGEMFKLFGQYQWAKNLSADSDLPRRPGWTFGLSGKQKLYSLSLSSDVKWVSERVAFDGSMLNSFWDTVLRVEHRGFEFSVSNFLDQDRPVLKGLERRPITFELKYQKTF